ncbi:hypothetical protein BJ508DRAFT_311793 [Ascobolus immersus RN42]|uniref:Uncharacterized protein n=1 Tax=Ascobolus immersus RN42 TaxID=1160509 RepID=A0A3N4I136_ASCIM|nr:hypothetical protein BJ508DRAFT_311793 [Ascobolus immersus RN42]
MTSLIAWKGPSPYCKVLIVGQYMAPVPETSPLEIYFHPSATPISIEPIQPSIQHLSEKQRKTGLQHFTNEELQAQIRLATNSKFTITYMLKKPDGTEQMFTQNLSIGAAPGKGLMWNTKALKLVDWSTFKSSNSAQKKDKINGIGIIIGREPAPIPPSQSSKGVVAGVLESWWRDILKELSELSNRPER